ncbi:GNAT family N-acetyltransferase [Nocardioides sp. GY 10113]|nr:GNAT family N-acetyltransferase [Nocardioides sp. GY 10113]
MLEDFGGVDEMHGSGHWFLDGDPEPTEAGCATFVEVLRAMAPAAADGSRVASTFYWIAEGDGVPGEELVGFLNTRHELNEFLLEQGGHIGYSVRPSRRGEGHAGRALDRALTEAAVLGLRRVLVTCDDDNEPSARTIERNGGVLEDVRGDKRRYWISVG